MHVVVAIKVLLAYSYFKHNTDAAGRSFIQVGRRRSRIQLRLIVSRKELIALLGD